MQTYRIIGADRKEYGPVSAEQVRRWMAEGRVNGQTLLQAEGATDWRALATFPEFADLLAAPPAAGSPPAFPGAAPGVSAELFSRDYELDIGRCVSQAWDLLRNQFGLLVGGVAIYLLVQMAISGVSAVPLVGSLASLGSLVVMGPLTGGLYYFVLKVIRGQTAEIGDVFAGFRLAFAQLLLGYLVTVVLIGLAALPGFGLMGYPIYRMVQQHSAEPLLLLWVGLASVVVIIPLMYLGVCWVFTLPLIIDKRMDFWPAMQASRRRVGQHWWVVFGLLVVCGLLNVAGFAACCVGVFVSAPLAFGAMMYAYEILFPATPAA